MLFTKRHCVLQAPLLFKVLQELSLLCTETYIGAYMVCRRSSKWLVTINNPFLQNEAAGLMTNNGPICIRLIRSLRTQGCKVSPGYGTDF